MKIKMLIKPPDSIWYITFCTGSGARAYKSLEPSNGGNGIILNTNNATFTSTNVAITFTTPVLSCAPKPFKKSAPHTAKTKLVSGPARPMRAAPNSSYLTLAGLKGTGFAAKKGGKPAKTNITGNNIEV